jgi:hypothetical protein
MLFMKAWDEASGPPKGWYAAAAAQLVGHQEYRTWVVVVLEIDNGLLKHSKGFILSHHV